MKFLVALLSLTLASAAKNVIGRSHNKLHKVPDSIKVNSELGSKVMSQARKLEQNDEIDFTWVADYSIKFQGCHHISQWNEEAEDEDDVRIATKRLVRFRLCPTNSCTLQNAGGCSSGYGDYVIDMNVFLEAYIDSVEQYNEARCDYLENTCGCDDENNNGGNEDYCQYDCYVAHGMEEVCAEENPYNANNGQEEEQDEFDLAEYAECAQANFGGRRRQLNQEVEYYVGPYCAEQGGAIYLGLFTDDTCTTFADEYGGQESYYKMAGKELPFGNSNVISMDCFSCLEPEVQYNYDGNDQEDDDNVNEMCEQIYEQAGKCESELGQYGGNYNACSYIQGIQVIRKNGIIVSTGSKANKTASIFIGVFVVAFVLLSAYVYYLKTKLDRATINLAE